jgi:hypothetical protein
MSVATHLLEKLFENRYNFVAPDSGPHKVPYTCSFHWFHTGEGRLIGLDLVRSDDMGRRALRVFRIGTDGKIDSLILEGPSSDWAPFATETRTTNPQTKPVIARGRNWVAGAATASGQSIESVGFELEIKVLVPGKGTGEAGLLLAHMNAMDYLRVEMSGWMQLNGERMALERVLGYSSVHFGDFLPNYAAIASVPAEKLDGAGILLNITDSDDIRHGAPLLGNKSLVYGYGCGPLPELALTIGNIERSAIPLGRAQVKLSDVQSVPHVLLDRPTTSGVARATYLANDGKETELGQVILDYRGTGYAPLLIS